MNHMNTAGHCRCPHHKVGAIILTLIGIVFLLGAMDVISRITLGYTWPILLIVLGLTRLMGGSCKCYARS